MAVAAAVAVALVVGGNKDNCRNSNSRGPYNNQLKGAVEEMTAAVTVTLTERATAA